MIVLPFLLMAAEPEIDCANATTQTAMNICSFDDFLAADSTLNAVWKEASAKAKQDEKEFSDGSFKNLLDAQRKWIAFRDAECLAQNGPRELSGTIWPLLQNGCLQKLTEARIQNLRDYIKVGN